MRSSDDELMAQGAGGQEEAFRCLVERWEGPIFAFLARMLGSPEEAQDLCQETFLRVIRSAKDYRASGQFRSWLFRIAGNLARSRLRRRKLVRWLSLNQLGEDPPLPRPDPLAEQEIRERRDALRRAMASLPARQRQALVLKQYQDLSYREIAQAMDVSVASVQMLLHRAMTSLRRELQRGGLSDEL